MGNDKVAQLAESPSFDREVAGSVQTGALMLQTLFHLAVHILSSKNNHFGKESQPKLSTDIPVSRT